MQRFRPLSPLYAVALLATMTCFTLACPQTVSQAIAPKPPPEIEYVGCFVDKRKERDLPVQGGINDDMKIELCSQFCSKQTYFGLQEGNQCWCGMSFNNHGKADEVECATRCMGNQNERCGGLLHNSVYKVIPP